MSSSRALCCSPSAKKQKHDFIFSVQCIIKLLDSVLVISRIIEVSVRVLVLVFRFASRPFILNQWAIMLNLRFMKATSLANSTIC